MVPAAMVHTSTVSPSPMACIVIVYRRALGVTGTG
jgi:hypothetical protein